MEKPGGDREAGRAGRAAVGSREAWRVGMARGRTREMAEPRAAAAARPSSWPTWRACSWMGPVGGWFSPCAVSPLCCFPPVLLPPCGVWLGLCVGRVDPALAFIRWQLAAWSDQPSGDSTPDSGWQMSGHHGCATAALSSTTAADTTAGTTAGQQHGSGTASRSRPGRHADSATSYARAAWARAVQSAADRSTADRSAADRQQRRQRRQTRSDDGEADRDYCRSNDDRSERPDGHAAAASGAAGAADGSVG